MHQKSSVILFTYSVPDLKLDVLTVYMQLFTIKGGFDFCSVLKPEGVTGNPVDNMRFSDA